jgi:glutamyl-tRNA synthetase
MKRDGAAMVAQGSDATPAPVGRLAPSPTGELHLGHARSFALAWWHTKSRGGRILLRLEDLDADRARSEYRDGVLRDLEWLGLEWDGPVRVQSDHVEEIRANAYQLIRLERAYPCVCTRADVRQSVNAPHADYLEVPYAGTCRGRFPDLVRAEASSGKAAGVRFRVPDEAVKFRDELRGELQERLLPHPGDFLILRRDKIPAYQLSVVVDDAAQGVTEVVRGDDLLDSTPRQVALAAALELNTPQYLHLPLVQDAKGVRLAKRHAALSLHTLREHGVTSGQILSWVARSAGFDVPAEITAAEMRAGFSFAHLPMEPVRFTEEQLQRWLDGA